MRLGLTDNFKIFFYSKQPKSGFVTPQYSESMQKLCTFFTNTYYEMDIHTNLTYLYNALNYHLIWDHCVVKV